MQRFATLLLAVLTCCLLFLACGEGDASSENADAAASARAQDAYLPEESDRAGVPAEVQQTAGEQRAIDPVTGYMDPVCRMQVHKDAEIRHTHEGVTFGFCSNACKERFLESPDQYLAALEE